MVLAKSGRVGSWVIAWISAAWSAKACSKAGRKCSGWISAKGGVSNGVCHGWSSGFVPASGAAASGWVSDITIPVFFLQNMRQSISRHAAFLGLLRLIDGGFSERLRPLNRTYSMSPQPTSTSTIVWPSVITVISAAILIGAEVFGAAFAGGWALAILFGLNDTAAHILQAVLFGIGVLIMVAFIRAAQRIEPFFKRG